MALMLASCGGADRAASSAQPVRGTAAAPISGSVLEWTLVPGRRSVVLIDPALIDVMTETRLRLDDGSVVSATPYVVRATPEREPGVEVTSVAARAGEWLGVRHGASSYRWSAAPILSAAEAEGGAAVLLLEFPESFAPVRVSAGALGARRVEIRWLEEVEGAPEGVFARSLDAAAWEAASIRGAMIAARGSPLQRWRARLAVGGFAPGATEEGAPFADAVVESLAQTIESEWRAALAALASADAALARRVVERLCATADFGAGVIAPVWPVEGERLSALLETMLKRTAAGLDISEAASGWLDEQPRLLAWVMDDAGSNDPGTGRPGGMVLAANLGAAPLAAWFETGTAPGAADITAIAPGVVRPVPTGGAGGRGGEARVPASVGAERAREGERLTLRVGPEVRRPLIFSMPSPAIAPGVRVGPLQGDWTLRDWLTAGSDDDLAARVGPWSDGSLVEAGWRTRGQVYRGVDAPLDRAAGVPTRWLLFLELGRGEGASEAGAGGYVRVWFGPLGRPSAVLRVLADGRVIDESPPGGRSSESGDVVRQVRVAETGAGWSCWLPIPLGAIEGDGVLRLGVERVDARGVHSAWPRPMLPWQQEPSRLAIDTSEWEGEAAVRK